MNAWLGIGGVMAALAGSMLGVRAAQRRGVLGLEMGRKTVHLAMGLVCTAFPWIFRDALPVVLLAFLSATGLAAVRRVPGLRAQLGGVLGGVERASLGEFYFAAAVALVWIWSHGDPFYYTAALAVLTLADTAGALVGRRYGTIFFGSGAGRKSLEGSLAVGLVALACLGLLLAWQRPAPWDVAVLSAVLVALVGLLAEAVARRGLDNLFLPVATYFVLHRCLSLEGAEVAGKLGVLVVLIALMFWWRRHTTRDLGTHLAVALMAYVFWVVAGWPWVLGPLFLLLARVPRPVAGTGPANSRTGAGLWVRQETLGIAGSLLLWIAA